MRQVKDDVKEQCRIMRQSKFMMPLLKINNKLRDGTENTVHGHTELARVATRVVATITVA